MAVILFGACRGEVSAPDEPDALARDSALKQQVFLANQDTLRDRDASSYEADTAPAFAEVELQSEPPLVEPPPAALERGPVSTAPTAAVERGPVPTPVETVARPRETAPEPAAIVPARPASPSPAVVPAGTKLSLEVGRRICVNTSRVGDRFSARLSRSVTGASGTVIPSGARATVEISSLAGPLGEEDIAIDIKSISVGGNTYNVASRVTHIELDRRPGAYRCIPEDGRIEARLTRPLRIRP